jgi:hypothetical protein
LKFIVFLYIRRNKSNKKDMEKQTDFRIRSYGRTELAQLYNPCLTPKAAYRKLVGWIDHYPGLAVRLAELGKLPGSRSYTPAQVREIVGALGEP